MRVIVTGGRDYNDLKRIKHVLTGFDIRFVVVVHGGARGADRHAAFAAEKLGFRVEEFPADWAQHGRAAGPIRNQQMLNHARVSGPALVVAFPGGNGTADMKRRARRAGVPVLEVT